MGMFRRLALLMLVPAVAAACGTSADAGQQLRDAATALKAVKTVQMDFKFGAGATVQLSGLTVDLVTATAKVKLPTDSELVGRVKQGDNIVEARIVTVGSDTYVKAVSFLPATKLSPTDAAQYPNAARLTNPDSGLPSAMAKGQGATISGTESVDGHDSYQVDATYTPDDLRAALTPFTPADKLQVTFWIAKDDHLVRRALIKGHIFNPTSDSSIEVHLHDFNAAVDITPPA
jgi:hypothetical protein